MRKSLQGGDLVKLLTLAFFASLVALTGCGLTLTKSGTVADLEREITQLEAEIEITRERLAICNSASEHDELTKQLMSLINERNKAEAAPT